MPVDYRISVPHHLVISRAWGVMSDQEMFAHARKVAADPTFRPDMRQVADLRHVTRFGLDSASVDTLVRLNPFGPGARRALLVGSDVAFGMARMYQLTREPAPDDVAVFREVHEALAWLGLTEHAAEVTALLEADRPPAEPR